MKKLLLVVITVALGFVFAGQLAQADLDRLTYEHRDGRELDNEVKRGTASVTRSPLFTNGVRLACWASASDDYAMATAIYYFDIPFKARSVKIKIPYIGGKRSSGIAGDVWIRRAGTSAEYYPKEERYEASEAQYGDTFELRDDRYIELIEVSAGEHRVDGQLELHVVVEGSQCIDVRYIEVETYAYSASESREIVYRDSPSERVVERVYYPSTTVYVERSWWDPYRPYWYWYTGLVWRWEWNGYYWVRVRYRYPYPRYRHHYVAAHHYWNRYWRTHPRYHVPWVNVYRRRPRHRSRLAAWTSDCERVRRMYRRAFVAREKNVDPASVRRRVRSILAQNKRRGEENRTVVASSSSASLQEASRNGRKERGTGGLFAQDTRPVQAERISRKQESQKRRSSSPSLGEKGMGYTSGMWGSKESGKGASSAAPSRSSVQQGYAKIRRSNSRESRTSSQEVRAAPAQHSGQLTLFKQRSRSTRRETKKPRPVVHRDTRERNTPQKAMRVRTRPLSRPASTTSSSSSEKEKEKRRRTNNR